MNGCKKDRIFINTINERTGGYGMIMTCSELIEKYPIHTRVYKHLPPTYGEYILFNTEHIASFYPAMRCSESGFRRLLAQNTPIESMSMVQYHHIWE